MAELGVYAYPMLLATTLGVYLLGREAPWGRYEALRTGAMGAVLGLIVAVQVSLYFAGVLDAPMALGAALMSTAGLAGLSVMYLRTGARGRWVAPQAS